jgi:hypothetical protein
MFVSGLGFHANFTVSADAIKAPEMTTPYLSKKSQLALNGILRE